MKKITALLLGIMMAFQLTACSSESSSTSQTEDIQSNTEQTSQKDSTTISEANTEDTQATKPDSGTGKTLVVYYSATGNTEEAAQLIAEETGGDLFELEPVDPYSDSDLNWSDEDSRVTKEHENPDQRDVELVKTTVDGWDEYDTVFIGYPIWWGIAAWPVDGFVQNNDFTGKTVIPFATSSSSGLGESGELLEEMAGSGNWLEGHRFSSRVSREDVQSWLEELE